VTAAQAKIRKPDPCSFVIFGVTGDLTHRLVIPALYNLAASGLLPDNFCIVGIARKKIADDALRDSLMKGLREFATQKVDDAIAKKLLGCVTCLEADPKDPASFEKLLAATAFSISLRLPARLHPSAVNLAASDY